VNSGGRHSDLRFVTHQFDAQRTRSWVLLSWIRDSRGSYQLHQRLCAPNGSRAVTLPRFQASEMHELSAAVNSVRTGNNRAVAGPSRSRDSRALTLTVVLPPGSEPVKSSQRGIP